MGLESTATYIDSLNESWPLSSDFFQQGADHLRLIKGALKRTFPNVTGEVSASHGAINYIKNVTSDIQTQLDAISASLADRMNDFPNQVDYTSVAGTYVLSSTGREIITNRLSGVKKGDILFSSFQTHIVPGASATNALVTFYVSASSSSGAKFSVIGAASPSGSVFAQRFAHVFPQQNLTQGFYTTFHQTIASGSGSVVIKTKVKCTTNGVDIGNGSTAMMSTVFMKSRDG